MVVPTTVAVPFRTRGRGDDIGKLCNFNREPWCAVVRKSEPADGAFEKRISRRLPANRFQQYDRYRNYQPPLPPHATDTTTFNWVSVASTATAATATVVAVISHLPPCKGLAERANRPTTVNRIHDSSNVAANSAKWKRPCGVVIACGALGDGGRRRGLNADRRRCPACIATSAALRQNNGSRRTVRR